MAAFMGLRTTADWATDQRPLSWREGILLLFPNGSAPLYALTSISRSEKVDDPQYHWWTKALQRQGGSFTVTEIYTDVAMGTKLATAGTSGQTLYVKVAEAIADDFRVGHLALLRDASDLTEDVIAKVTGVTANGASSRITVKLLEADDNSSHSHDLRDADTILVAGNLNPEFGERPSSIHYDPVKQTNYTQIWRTALDLSRTALKTNLRTGDAYQEEKRETLELHSLEIEKNLMWGIATENIGANGKKERTTAGLVSMIRANASSNVFDFVSDTDFSGQSWIQGGDLFFDKVYETLFRYGDGEKLAFCGSAAMKGIAQLARSIGQINLTTRTTEFGMKITEWLTPYGVVNLKLHPLMSQETTLRDAMIVFEPRRIRFRFIDDTMFKEDTRMNEGGDTGLDGRQEEYLTEGGLEYHHYETAGFLTGVSKANTA